MPPFSSCSTAMLWCITSHIRIYASSSSHISWQWPCLVGGLQNYLRWKHFYSDNQWQPKNSVWSRKPLFMDEIFKAAPTPLQSSLHHACTFYEIAFSTCFFAYYLLKKGKHTIVWWHSKEMMVDKDFAFNPLQIMLDFKTRLMRAISAYVTTFQYPNTKAVTPPTGYLAPCATVLTSADISWKPACQKACKNHDHREATFRFLLSLTFWSQGAAREQQCVQQACLGADAPRRRMIYVVLDRCLKWLKQLFRKEDW